MRIDVIVFEGFDELDAFGPYEVFGHARAAGADVDLAYAGVGLDAGDTVTATHGTTLAVQRAAGPADLVVVPGGGWHDPGPGAREEVARGVLPAYLTERHSAGALVAAVCTGGMVLAASGLLVGRRATTHHGSIEELPDHGAVLVRERVVDDGDILTAGGVTSGIDLALHLVERLFGASYAEHAATQMEHPRKRVGEPSVV